MDSVLTPSFWYQVGDLGLSKVKCRTLISGGVRGTLPWMAPELLNGSSSLVSEKVCDLPFPSVLYHFIFLPSLTSVLYNHENFFLHMVNREIFVLIFPLI